MERSGWRIWKEYKYFDAFSSGFSVRALWKGLFVQILVPDMTSYADIDHIRITIDLYNK